MMTGEDLTAAMQDAGMTEAPAPMSLEQCVPLAALALPDEGEQLANPEVGDRVSYTVEGTVTRIEGDKAYIDPENVNGQPMQKEAPETSAGYGMPSVAGVAAVLLLFVALGAFGQSAPYSVSGSYYSSNQIATTILPSGTPTVTYVNASSTDAGSTLKLLSLGNGTHARIRSSLSSVTITAGGKYDSTTVPTVSFSGGDPDTAASGRARMKALSVEIINGGTNYTDLDIERVVDDDGGTAVDLEVTVNQNKAITNIAINTAGALTNPPANNVTVTNLSGGGGSNAILRITWAVTSVALDNVGTNYKTAPTVTFSGTSINNSNAAGTTTLATGSNPLAAGTNTLYLISPDSYFTAGGLIGITHTNGVLQLCHVHSVTSSNVVITNLGVGGTTLWHIPTLDAPAFRPVTTNGSIAWGNSSTPISAPEPGLFIGGGPMNVLALWSTNTGSAINQVVGRR